MEREKHIMILEGMVQKIVDFLGDNFDTLYLEEEPNCDLIPLMENLKAYVKKF